MTDSQSSKSRPKVIILGAGFAGLNAAKPLGVPTPVGPSYPATPLHMIVAQFPFEPLVTSCRLAGESDWCPYRVEAG